MFKLTSGSGFRATTTILSSVGLVLGGWLSSSRAIALPLTVFPPAANGTSAVEIAQRVGRDTRFTCEQVNGEYLVMYSPASQPDQSYEWARPSEMGGGWTPARRCAEISRRLESYRPDGLLEMRTGLENGYNIVCVTTERNPSCRIVLTVPPGQDPLATRDRVFENLAVADSGQRTDAVNTLLADDDALIQQLGAALNLRLPRQAATVRRAQSIDLRPFLDRADGGTATRLRR